MVSRYVRCPELQNKSKLDHLYRSLIDLIILFTQYITTLFSDVICHNGFTKEKVMLHSKESFQFGSDANTTDVRCKVAYKVVRYRQRVSTFSPGIDRN